MHICRYDLLVYSRSPVTITPLGGHDLGGHDLGGGSSEDAFEADTSTAMFARYDRNGQGRLSREELGLVLTELGLLRPSLGPAEQRQLIEEHFERAVQGGLGDVDGGGDGISLGAFLKWYRGLSSSGA